MMATILRFAAMGFALPAVFVGLLWLLKVRGGLKTIVGLALLLSCPPHLVLSALGIGLSARELVALAVGLNVVLYAGVGAWMWSSRGRPNGVRYGVVLVPWLVLEIAVYLLYLRA